MRRHRHGTGGEAGTTLIELLLAVVMLGVVVMGIFYLWSYNQQAYLQGSEAAEVQHYARAAMETLSREIRLAGYDPCRYVVPKADLGAPPLPWHTDCVENTNAGAVTRTAFGPGRTYSAAIVCCDPTGLTIRMDRNGDGQILTTQDPAEIIVFSYANPILSRTAGNGSAQEVARSVNTFVLAYLQADGITAVTDATQWDRISVIRITLGVQQAFLGSPVTATLTSDIKLRDR